MSNDKKKMDNETNNDVQMFHVIAFYVVFKKLSEKKLQEEAFCI